MNNNSVNHPAYYQDPSGAECIVIAERMSFNAGNAFKYLWRAGLKESADYFEDLRKAQWYLNREVARLEAEGILKSQILGNYRPYHALDCPARQAGKSADICTCGGLPLPLFKQGDAPKSSRQEDATVVIPAIGDAP